jgi:hypothetical protein
VDEGLFGEIPESIKYHLDYDSIARDLGMDYTETVIAGTSLIYRCGYVNTIIAEAGPEQPFSESSTN